MLLDDVVRLGLLRLGLGLELQLESGQVQSAVWLFAWLAGIEHLPLLLEMHQ